MPKFTLRSPCITDHFCQDNTAPAIANFLPLPVHEHILTAFVGQSASAQAEPCVALLGGCGTAAQPAKLAHQRQWEPDPTFMHSCNSSQTSCNCLLVCTVILPAAGSGSACCVAPRAYQTADEHACYVSSMYTWAQHIILYLP